MITIEYNYNSVSTIASGCCWKKKNIYFKQALIRLQNSNIFCYQDQNLIKSVIFKNLYLTTFEIFFENLTLLWPN